MPSGVKLSRPVEQHPRLGRFQRRQAVQRVHHHRLEMVPVLGQEAEGEILAERAGRYRFPHRLEAADQQPAAVVADIEPTVMVGEGGHIAVDALHRPGQQVEMLAREQRRPRPGHGGDLARPEARADRNGIAHDGARARLDAAHPPVSGEDAGHAHILEQPGPARPRPSGQRRRDIGGADPPVARRPDRPQHVVGVHERPALLRLAGAYRLRFHAEGMGERLLPADVDQPVRRRGNGQRALADQPVLWPVSRSSRE